MDCTLLFDIDGVLAELLDFDAQRRLRSASDRFGAEFLQRHTIEVMGLPHVVVPGWYACWAWLHGQGADIRVFSAGLRERNEAFTAAFALRAFAGLAPSGRPSIPVLSREDRVDTSSFSPAQDEAIQGFWPGLSKKVLARVVPPDRVPSTLLIEDDTSYAARGEEPNLVLVPRLSFFPPGSDARENWRGLHRAFYVTGMLAAMQERVQTIGCTWAQASYHLQVEFTGAPLDASFRHPTRTDRAWYDRGREVLRSVEPALDWLFEAGPTEW